jgi:lipoprotein-releasing system permease protein
LNFEFFIVRKIAFSSRKNFSAFIIRIAIAAVTLSMATMIIASSMVNGFQNQIRQKVMGFFSHLLIKPYSLGESIQEEPVYKYEDFYKNPGMIPDVAHIQVTAFKGGLIKTDEDFEGIVLKGVGTDYDWNNLKPYLKEGNIINTASDTSLKDIMVSRTTASRLNLALGDKLIVSFLGNSIRNRPFRVRGIYETGIEEFDKKYALVNIAIIQELNNWGPDTVGGFEVFLKQDKLFKSRARAYFLSLFGGALSTEKFDDLNRDPLDDIAFSLMPSNPTLEVKTIKDINPGIFDWLDLQTTNELIILIIMMVVAVINMITTLLILILERTNMIGILKALGSNNNSVQRLFVIYGLMIIGVGLLFGNIAGIGLCLLQQYTGIITLPQDSYYLTVAPIEINWWWILFLNVFTIVTCMLILSIPAILAKRIQPVQSIRFS